MLKDGYLYFRKFGLKRTVAALLMYAAMSLHSEIDILEVQSFLNRKRTSTSKIVNLPYAKYWLTPWPMDKILAEYHDGVTDLHERARRFSDQLFSGQRFQPSCKVLEFGIGVGYIAEEFLKRYDVKKLVGLDISNNTLEKARERFKHPKLEYALYDGYTIPFPDDFFDIVYSCDTIHHIEEHVMFHLFSEIMRVMKPNGKAFLHILAWKDAPQQKNYLEWCRQMIRKEACHWLVLYSREELEIILGKMLHAVDLLIEPFWKDGVAYRVTFRK